MTLGDIGQFFGGVAAMGGTIISIITLQRVGKVDKKVDTLNELTVGELQAREETRRIEAKQQSGKPITAQEQRHIDAADKEQG